MATIYDSISQKVEEKVSETVGEKNVLEFKKVVMVWMIYFVGILVLRLLFRGVVGVLSLWSLFFLAGGIAGMLVPVVDRLVFVYYSRPDDEVSKSIKQLIAQKRYLEAVRMMYERKRELYHLSMDNVVFMAVWVMLAVFLVTSSSSAFAKGMVLGIGLEMVLSLKHDWGEKKYLVERLFWPLKRKISDEELKTVVAVFGGLFGLMSVLVA